MMNAELEDGGQSLTDQCPRGLFRRRNRVSMLQPQRVPVSAIIEGVAVGEDDDTDSATPSMGSATARTVSAILASRHDRHTSGGDSGSIDHDKENAAERRGAPNPFDLLTPLPRRGTTPSAGRPLRKPLGVIDTPYQDTATPQPAISSAMKRSALDEGMRTLSHARSQSTLSTAAAAQGDRTASGLSRGLSDPWLPGRALAERPRARTATPPEAGGRVGILHTPPEQVLTTAATGRNEAGRVTMPSVSATSHSVQKVTLQAQRVSLHTNTMSSHVEASRVMSCTSTTATSAVNKGCLSRSQMRTAVGTLRPEPAVTSSCSKTSVSHVQNAPRTPEPRMVSLQRQVSGSGLHGNQPNAPARMPSSAPAQALATPSLSRSEGSLLNGALMTTASRPPLSSHQTPSSYRPNATAAPVGSLAMAYKPVDAAIPASLAGAPRVQASAAPVASSSLQPSVPPSTQDPSPPPTASRPASTLAACAAPVPAPHSLPAQTSQPQSARAPQPQPPPVAPHRQQQESGAPAVRDITSSPGANMVSTTITTTATRVAVAPQLGSEPGTSAMLPPPPPPAPCRLKPICVNGQDYLMVKQVGRGGSSKVYRVLDSSNHLLALKQVFLESVDATTARGYMNEIDLLRRLRNSDRVISLIDFEHNVDHQMLYIVMEHGETDLSGLLRTYTRLNEVDVNMCKFFWGEMLRCVDVIHKEGIIHLDLKPSNFLLVSGRLKLIDFGIASRIQSDCTSVIKDTQVGTFNYMSPEAIEAQQVTRNGTAQTAIKISRRSDVWSLGCILYYFVYGVTPFGHIKQMMGKLMAIVNPQYAVSFADLADRQLLAVLKACLQRDPYQRPDINQLLSHPYLVGQY